MEVGAVACFGAETVLGTAHGRSFKVVRVLYPVIHVLVCPIIEFTRGQDWVGLAAGDGGGKFFDVVIDDNMRCRLQVGGQGRAFLVGERTRRSRVNGVADLCTAQVEFLL